ncbi:MAG: type I-E CRISPR-associated protein Cse1/CasA, partial [Gammaproteobacteria bacterium]
MLQLNLSRDAWISVKGRPGKDRSGVIHQIAPTWVSAPEFQSIDTGRPDFDGTLAQFLIALLQTTLPPKDKREWRERLYEPPTAEELRAAFAPYSRAFELA